MRVHIVSWPAADGDGVRMIGYEDPADAQAAAQRLDDSQVRITDLNIVPAGEEYSDTAPLRTGPLTDRVRRIVTAIDNFPDDERAQRRAAIDLHGDLQRAHSAWLALPDDDPERDRLRQTIHTATKRLLKAAGGAR